MMPTQGRAARTTFITDICATPAVTKRLSPTGGDAAQATAREGFLARLSAFSSTVLGDSWCSNATDHDGRKLWQAEEGGCIWTGGEVWHFEGETDAERLVRIELPFGDVAHYQGKQHAVRLVRYELPYGGMIHFDGMEGETDALSG